MLLILVGLTAIGFVKANKFQKRTFYFLGMWFVLALAPVCKIFSYVMSPACGGRIAYLATAPLCLFLTFGIAKISADNRSRLVLPPAVMSCLALAAVALHSNNVIWAEAGSWANIVFLEFPVFIRI